LASLPDVERDLYRNSRPDVDWDDDHGDRRTELVFIGQGIEKSLSDRLDRCLVSDEEWEQGFETDPFPTAEGEPLTVHARTDQM